MPAQNNGFVFHLQVPSLLVHLLPLRSQPPMRTRERHQLSPRRNFLQRATAGNRVRRSGDSASNARLSAPPEKIFADKRVVSRPSSAPSTGAATSTRRIGEHRHARRQLDHGVEIVRDEHHGQTHRAMQRRTIKSMNSFGRLRIEPAGGFIEESSSGSSVIARAIPMRLIIPPDKRRRHSLVAQARGRRPSPA